MLFWRYHGEHENSEKLMHVKNTSYTVCLQGAGYTCSLQDYARIYLVQYRIDKGSYGNVLTMPLRGTIYMILYKTKPGYMRFNTR